ncbi:MAG: hypothetical protein JWM57_1394 [Phycisphaerales bacterium]|nr:hypothetical protein [Phycisphaerales bacterium]
MLTRPLRRSAAAAVSALLLLVGASPSQAADAPSTVGALLTGVTPTAPATPADLHALQNKLQSEWAGKAVTVDAGVIIQIVTEGGGVKLISFPPNETIGAFSVRQALSHATLLQDQEAAGKKLAPGDKYVVTGKVASLSAQFSGKTTEDGKAEVRLNLTLNDAKIDSTTIAPKRKKAVATQAAPKAE